VLASRTAQPSGCDTRRPSLAHARTSSHAIPSDGPSVALGAFDFFSSLEDEDRNSLRSGPHRPPQDQPSPDQPPLGRPASNERASVAFRTNRPAPTALPTEPIARHQPPGTNRFPPPRPGGPLRRRSSLPAEQTAPHQPPSDQPPDQLPPRLTAELRHPAEPPHFQHPARARKARLRRPFQSALPGRSDRASSLLGRALRPSTRDRVPDENCFLVRRLRSRDIRHENANSPSGEIHALVFDSVAPTATPPCATAHGR